MLYLEKAKNKYENTDDYDAEELENAINRFGAEIHTCHNEARLADLKATREYLLSVLERSFGISLDSVKNDKPTTEHHTVKLDASPLTPLDEQVISLSDEEKQSALQNILQSELGIKKGISASA